MSSAAVTSGAQAGDAEFRRSGDPTSAYTQSLCLRKPAKDKCDDDADLDRLRLQNFMKDSAKVFCQKLDR